MNSATSPHVSYNLHDDRKMICLTFTSRYLKRTITHASRADHSDWGTSPEDYMITSQKVLTGQANPHCGPVVNSRADRSGASRVHYCYRYSRARGTDGLLTWTTAELDFFVTSPVLHTKWAAERLALSEFHNPWQVSGLRRIEGQVVFHLS